MCDKTIIFHSNLLFAVFGLCLLMVEICTGCSCKALATPGLLTDTEGKILVGHTYGTLQAKNVVICAVRCMRQRKCDSFNYQKSAHKCALNDASHASASSDMKQISSDEAVYYDISQWDKTWLGSCLNHACPTESICESVSGSYTIKHKCSATYSADISASPIDLQSLGVCTLTDGCADCTEPGDYTLVTVDGSVTGRGGPLTGFEEWTVSGQGRGLSLPESNLPHTLTVAASRTYSAVGCYNQHVLSVSIENFRGNMDWADVNSFTNIVQKCAEMSTGYEYFGIEFYGECYAGNSTEASFSNSVSAVDCNSKCLYLGVGVGSGNVMFVYQWQ